MKDEKFKQSISFFIAFGIFLLVLIAFMILDFQQRALEADAYAVWSSFVSAMACLVPVIIIAFGAITLVAIAPYIWGKG